MTQSRAVRFDRFGDRSVLYVTDVPVPTPAAGEVVVAVRAAGINPGEVNIRSGALAKMFPTTFPSGQGSDLAGVVTAVGPDVTGFAIGDEVLGYSWTRSSHADYTAVPVTQVIHKPASLSWEVAGSLYVVGATAYVAVRAVDPQPGREPSPCRPRPVEWVAWSCSCWPCAVYTFLALHRRPTTNGCARTAPPPVAYGDGLADRLTAAAPQGIDAFIDTFGPEYLQLAVDLGIQPDRIETIIAFEKAGELGTKAQGSTDGSSAEVLTEIADLLAAGSIEIPIAAVYPLDQVTDAFTELEQHHTHGKIVLRPLSLPNQRRGIQRWPLSSRTRRNTDCPRANAKGRKNHLVYRTYI